MSIVENGRHSRRTRQLSTLRWQIDSQDLVKDDYTNRIIKRCLNLDLIIEQTKERDEKGYVTKKHLEFYPGTLEMRYRKTAGANTTSKSVRQKFQGKL